MSDELPDLGGVPGQQRAAGKLLEAEGDVLKVIDGQRIAGGQFDGDTVRMYVLPIILDALGELLPWPLRNNKDLTARLAGRCLGVAAGLTATAIEAERAYLEEQGA